MPGVPSESPESGDTMENILKQILEGQNELKHTVNQQGRIMEHHSEVLQEQTKVLTQFGEELREQKGILNQHTEMLQHHSVMLEQHSEILEKQTEMLQQHSEILDKHTEQLDWLGKGQQRLETKVENEVADKIRALFDDREIENERFDHLEKRFDFLEHRFDRLEGRFDLVINKLEDITTDVRYLVNRVDKLEKLAK